MEHYNDLHTNNLISSTIDGKKGEVLLSEEKQSVKNLP
jgi:hypothetical protein